MSKEFKVLESRLVAQAMVIEALMKQLMISKAINTEDLVAELQESIDAPVSINADPVNIASMKYDLSNWQETILHISENV